jgi:hypothetical protein
MNSNTTAKVKTLLAIKTANYRAAGESHPEVAAQNAVEGILNAFKSQMKYIDQLLNEEIEDSIKAGKAA